MLLLVLLLLWCNDDISYSSRRPTWTSFERALECAMMLRNADRDLKMPERALKKESKAFSEGTAIDHEDR